MKKKISYDILRIYVFVFVYRMFFIACFVLLLHFSIFFHYFLLFSSSLVIFFSFRRSTQYILCTVCISFSTTQNSTYIRRSGLWICLSIYRKPLNTFCSECIFISLRGYVVSVGRGQTVKYRLFIFYLLRQLLFLLSMLQEDENRSNE